jgi:lactoylglutathione lyase
MRRKGPLGGCRLTTVRVFVRDWEAARRFYTETLGLPPGLENAQLGWAEFDIGGPVLALERVADDEADVEALVGRFVGISLAVDDMEAAYRSLRGAGVTFAGPPARQPWGGTLAHFEDPEGNVITLLSR